MGPTEGDYFSVAETARTLGLIEAAVYRRVWDGSLPVFAPDEHGATGSPGTLLSLPPERRAPFLG